MQPINDLPLTALTCLNGLKHGGTSMSLFIHGEEPQDFYNLLAESFEIHQPSAGEDSATVTDAVVARWYLWRRQRAHGKREIELYRTSSEPDSLYPAAIQELMLFDRYRIQAERTLVRCLANVRNLKKDALAGEKWRAQLELQKSPFELERQRFELRQAQDSRVAAKVAAEAERDAYLANSALERLKSLENIEPAPPKPPQTLVVENNECILKQIVIVSQKDGIIELDHHPKNQRIQYLIDIADRCLIPPQKVVREFHFLGGMIPEPYQWVFEGLDRAGLLFKCPLDHPGLRVPMTFETFAKLAAQEALLSDASQTHKEAS